MLISLGGASVRSFQQADARQLARHASDSAVTAYMHDSTPRQYTVAEAEAWIELVRSQSPECKFSIARGEEIIGGISLELQHDIYAHSAEISYWVAEARWRQGIATRAVTALSDYAFRELRLARVYARVFDGNTASVRVLQKCAFELEGRLRHAAVKNGHLTDQFLYAKLRGAH